MDILLQATQSFANMFSNENAVLSEPVRRHLREVYLLLGSTLICAAFGCWGYLYVDFFSRFSGIISLSGLASIFGLIFLSTTRKTLRLACLFAFAFSDGFILGPFIEEGLNHYEELIHTAFWSALVVFGSFSVAGFFTTGRRQQFYQLSILLSFLSAGSLIFAFASMFTQKFATLHLLLGVVSISLYVLYDTHLIIRRVEQSMGEKVDPITDTFKLYKDAVELFFVIYRLLVTQKEKEERSRKREERRRKYL
ncbi:Bax inhibitor 1 [Basidiobolus ranarum]|uniref:Bax inhibitor 1 n=1 Tax=Basidiobolus ranarum TaxID=34480 RepID=A0ABR2W1J5_9FUNG